jgi:hypothetical protein
VVINFLHETLEALKQIKKSPVDIAWVGTTEAYMTWAEFACLADRTYESTQDAVRGGLYIVGDTWWLERKESRWVPFQKPQYHVKLTLFSDEETVSWIPNITFTPYTVGQEIWRILRPTV